MQTDFLKQFCQRIHIGINPADLICNCNFDSKIGMQIFRIDTALQTFMKKKESDGFFGDNDLALLRCLYLSI
jgi:hypothetical protein